MWKSERRFPWLAGTLETSSGRRGTGQAWKIPHAGFPGVFQSCDAQL